jgi:hypothetical protein
VARHSSAGLGSIPRLKSASKRENARTQPYVDRFDWLVNNQPVVIVSRAPSALRDRTDERAFHLLLDALHRAGPDAAITRDLAYAFAATQLPASLTCEYVLLSTRAFSPVPP